MADISKITLPNGSEYNVKDFTARTESVTSASISGSGLLEFRNSAGNLLFTLPLDPLYIPFTNIANFFARSTNQISALSVIVGSPSQDLHGYDSPWPAGGGKNKLKYPYASGSSVSANNVTYTVNSDESITITTNGTASAQTDFFLWGGSSTYEDVGLSSGTYTFSIESSASLTSGTLQTFLREDGVTNTLFDQNVTGTSWNASTAISDTAGHRWLLRVASGKAVNTTIKIQVEAGSTATAWEPYSNECPITGYTGVNIYDDPKYGGTVAWNQYANGYSYTANSGAKTFNLISGCQIIQGHKLFMSIQKSGTNSNNLDIYLFTRQNNTNNAFLFRVAAGNTEKNPATIKSAVQDGVGGHANSNGNAWIYHAATDVDLSNFMLIDLTAMFGSTIADYIYSLERNTAGAGVAWFRNLFPKDYYAYNAGETTCVSAVNDDPYWKKTVDWTSAAGTVYSWTLEALTGKLTVTHAGITLNGSESWSGGGTNGFYTQVNGLNKLNNYANSILCDKLKTYATNSGQDFKNADTGITGYYDASGNYPSQNWIYAKVSGISTGADLKTWLQSNPLQVVYELATPVEYTLTPQQVEALMGQNYVWADIGDIRIDFHYSDVLPLVTPNDNGKIMMVVNGAWSKVNLPVYNGGVN